MGDYYTRDGDPDPLGMSESEALILGEQDAETRGDECYATYTHPEDIDLGAAVAETSGAIIAGVDVADGLESLESLEAEIRRLRGQRATLAAAHGQIARKVCGDGLCDMSAIAASALAEVGLSVAADGGAR